MRKWAVFVAIAACGSHASTPPARRDAGTPAPASTMGSDARELPARPLGLPALTGFEWRARPGQVAFRAARVAEAAGNWPAVVRACTQALAADPGHLDAAWLLAVAYAKTSALDAVTAPLALAGAGDYDKWAMASLAHPALQPYLATAEGSAWRRRVEHDRPAYVAALGRSIVVAATGDLYAYDPATPRWYRLTRSNGRVIAALAAGRVLAFVTRAHGRFGVGVIDLEDGHTTHAVDVGPATAVLAVAPTPQGFWIGLGPAAHTLALDGTLAATTARRPGGVWLQVAASGAARVNRLPITSVSADWDQTLASAIRLGTTNRVVTVPSPGLIAGNTIAWSPDRSHLAFAAQLADQCTKGAPTVAAFVADASTGTVQELARATAGVAIEWVTDTQLAVAGDRGAALVGLDGSSSTPLAGTTGLASPMFTAKCTPPPTEAAEPQSDDEPTDSP